MIVFGEFWEFRQSRGLNNLSSFDSGRESVLKFAINNRAWLHGSSVPCYCHACTSRWLCTVWLFPNRTQQAARRPVQSRLLRRFNDYDAIVDHWYPLYNPCKRLRSCLAERSGGSRKYVVFIYWTKEQCVCRLDIGCLYAFLSQLWIWTCSPTCTLLP